MSNALFRSWQLPFLLLLGCLFPAWAGEAIATAPQNATVRIPRVEHAPKLADFLSSTRRESETRVTGFRQREPRDGKPASRKTAAYLSYDSVNLYVAFECEADPAKLRARFTRRDQISGDETVSVSLDTFHDKRRAYMFFSNPYGVQMDGMSTEGQEDDFSFDTVWHSWGQVTATGYTVLFAIPFKSLRFPVEGGRDWGIALTRYSPDSKEFVTFPHISQTIDSYVGQFATLAALEHVSPGRNIRLTPYGFFANQRFLDESTRFTGPSFEIQRELRAGLDAKVVLRDSFTLDATVNPDFSQVESDEPQVTVNQRFEVYFPERRPFFLENAGYFETPETLFFSRRIVNPRVGSRLTGKAGGWSVGLLAADDRDHATIGVARVQRDIGRQSTAGFLFTSRDFLGISNRVFSADTRLRLSDTWSFSGQFMRSDTTTGKAAMHGTAAYAALRHASRHWTHYTTFRQRDPEFQTALGYIPRVDLRQVRSGTGYRWRPESGPLLSFGPSAYLYANWDMRGTLQDWYAELPFRFEFRGPTSVEVSRTAAYEVYRGRGFRKDGNYADVYTDRLRWFGVYGSIFAGRGVNYYPARGLAPFAADSLEGRAGITVRPTKRLRIDESYLYSALRLPSGPAVFTNHVARSKINFQFNRTLSLRAIIDYNGVQADQSLVNLDRIQRLTTDLLFTYLVHPGTAIHAGYSDRRENLDPSRLDYFGRPTFQTGRQVFVKLSYMVRL
ncbi:MAG: DUF5916 domain-containing protein [Bryobacteraceae bacterium]